MGQERFKYNLEFRYQIIVSSIKFKKGFAKFMIALFKKFLTIDNFKIKVVTFVISTSILNTRGVQYVMKTHS